ncbi:MAG: dTMP kinase [Dehalococcoidales bacterium]|nr:dTMP kinase [Dehalococcoidales bacterium]
MSLFITFEGGEGCGKTTQGELLEQRLKELVLPCLLTLEPGGTSLGDEINALVKKPGMEIDPLAEALLFNASRIQLVKKIIKPALEKGVIVISSRYADSTTAYQGYGRELDLKLVKDINKLGTDGLMPNLTILLDVPVEIGLKRKGKLDDDRFHSLGLDFHRRVREGFLKLAKAEPKRWLVIDGTKHKDEISGIIWNKVRALLSGRK